MREGTASAWKSVRRAKENEKLFYRVYIYLYIYTVSGVTLDPSTGGGPCNLYFLYLYIYIYTGCQSKSGYQPFGASKISKTCVAVCKGALKKTI